MAYIGKQPTVGNFVKLDSIVTSATTTFNLLNGGVAYSPQSPNHCLVSLNGILQAPTDSFTISGSTIIFSSALTTNDVIDFIIVLGDVLNIGTPSDNTVSLAKLTATGTKDSTTFLRGDNTFSTITTGFTSGTAVATTSGSSFDFTGIPSTTKLIILNLHEVSLTGGDNLYVQIGDSGGIETTGYLSTSAYAGASSSYTSSTDAFTIVQSSNTAVFSGLCFISLVDSSTNTWVSNHTGKHATNYVIWGGGSKSLSATLTQVRLTKGGSDTFDAGKVNILYI